MSRVRIESEAGALVYELSGPNAYRVIVEGEVEVEREVEVDLDEDDGVDA